jgi:hypothetical protein
VTQHIAINSYLMFSHAISTLNGFRRLRSRCDNKVYRLPWQVKSLERERGKERRQAIIVLMLRIFMLLAINILKILISLSSWLCVPCGIAQITEHSVRISVNLCDKEESRFVSSGNNISSRSFSFLSVPSCLTIIVIIELLSPQENALKWHVVVSWLAAMTMDFLQVNGVEDKTDNGVIENEKGKRDAAREGLV